MARDIEEFLRRAAERRKQQLQKKGGGAPPPQQQAPPPRQRQPQPPPRQQQPEPARRQPPPQTQPPRKRERLVIQDEQQQVRRKESVSEHVSSHIDTSRLGEHASHLGERISTLDKQVDERLHRKFDHDVGNLKGPTIEQESKPAQASVDEVSSIAKDLLELLSSPKSIRQSILISEILNRPKID